jgi:hypothetical protein
MGTTMGDTMMGAMDMVATGRTGMATDGIGKLPARRYTFCKTVWFSPLYHSQAHCAEMDVFMFSLFTCSHESLAQKQPCGILRRFGSQATFGILVVCVRHEESILAVDVAHRISGCTWARVSIC